MFKKKVSVVHSTALSGKDAKKLNKDVQQKFPQLSESDLKLLLPSKADVTQIKLSNKAVAYSITGGNPLFFDPEGRGDQLLPTVYATWLVPHILQPLFTYSEVSPKVLGGADLFLQGLIVPDHGLGTFAVGDPRVICVPANLYPFAVGVMETDSASVAKNGLKGKGLKLVHHYPDHLWALGDKSVPDPSFTTSRIFPQAEAAEDASAAASPAPAAPGDTAAAEADGAPAAAQQLGRLRVSDGSQAEEQGGAETSGAAGEASAAPPRSGADLDNMDAILEACLVGGLHRVEDSALPMLTSDFWQKYMLPCKPIGVNVDFKNSKKYKKLSKLLTTFEKKDLLTLKQVHKQDNLAAINRSSPIFTAFISETATTAPPTQSQVAGQHVNGASGNSGAPGPSEAGGGHFDISCVYRVPSSLAPIFAGIAGGDRERLYSESAVSEALDQYAKAQNLLLSGSKTAAAPGPDAIKLDRLLVGSLFNKKEVQMEGDSHPKDDLMQRLLGKLQLYHRVVRSTDAEGTVTALKKGKIGNIKLTLEDRQGGRKHLTRVAGLESFAIDPEVLAKQLQRKLNSNATVEKLPGKQETGREIALQGVFVNEVRTFLQSEFGIAAQYIDEVSKSKG